MINPGIAGSLAELCYCTLTHFLKHLRDHSVPSTVPSMCLCGGTVKRTLCRLNPVLNCHWYGSFQNNKGPLTLSEKSFHLCFTRRVDPWSFSLLISWQSAGGSASMLMHVVSGNVWWLTESDSGWSFPHIYIVIYIELSSAYLFLNVPMGTVHGSHGCEDQAAIRRTPPLHKWQEIIIFIIKIETD